MSVATIDPHCGRSSLDNLDLKVGGETWTVQWGHHFDWNSPAYWAYRVGEGGFLQACVRLKSNDLTSEVVFCLLGGFGVTAESAQVATRHLRSHVGFQPVDAATIEAVLRHPMLYPDGRRRRYRFPAQRASRVAGALEALSGAESEWLQLDDLALRERLLGLSGVGPKTASWVVRNLRGSDEVAIIDIWLVRSLTAAGVFRSDWSVARHYDLYEAAFLAFAKWCDRPASALDLCVWTEARRAARIPALASRLAFS